MGPESILVAMKTITGVCLSLILVLASFGCVRSPLVDGESSRTMIKNGTYRSEGNQLIVISEDKIALRVRSARGFGFFVRENRYAIRGDGRMEFLYVTSNEAIEYDGFHWDGEVITRVFGGVRYRFIYER